MAEYALFIGWGDPRAGREAAAGKMFAESMAHWYALKDAGEIESVEVVLLQPHGGDLAGFALLRGDPEKLGRISQAPETNLLSMRVQVCLEGVGIVPALVDGGVMRVMKGWNEAIADLV